jgi:hypothetical protein
MVKSTDLLWKELLSAYGDVNETTSHKNIWGSAEHHRSGLTINQPGYLQKIITDLDMSNSDICKYTISKP